MGAVWPWPLLVGGLAVFAIGLPRLRRRFAAATVWQPLVGVFFVLLAVRTLSGGDAGPAAGPLALAVSVSAIAAGLCAMAAALRPGTTDSGPQAGSLPRQRFAQEDLHAAIQRVTDKLAAAPDDATDRAALQAALGDLLCQRFEITGERADLDRAIQLGRAAVTGTPVGHPDHAGLLSNLGLALRHRFEHTGDRGDLEESIELGRRAVAGAADRVDVRTRTMANLAGSLQDRSARTGARADLDDAIDTARRAVAATDSPQLRSDLAGKLITRFKWSGEQADLDEAIDLERQAMAGTPANHPHRAVYLSAMTAALVLRFDRTGRRADLDDAIGFGRQAVAATHADHTVPIVALTNLGTALQARIRQSLAAADATAPRGVRQYLAAAARSVATGRHLHEAIDIARRAVAATPAGHAYHAGTLGNLGGVLLQRAVWSGRRADVDAAIAVTRQAVTAAADQPDKTALLANLGLALEARFELTGRHVDQDEALASYRAAVDVTAAPPVTRAGAARSWLGCAESDGDDTSMLAALSAATGLLPTLAWHGLDRPSRERHLTDWSGLAADAAACAIRAGEPQRAVELLEQGRSVLWNQILHIRGDLTRLARQAPEIAARLDRIRSVLDTPTGAAFPEPVARDTRMRLAGEWDELITQVRQRTGFEHFLAATPFARLRHAADAGPVVIVNVSRYRCDALVVTGSTTTPIALPDLTLTAATERADNLQSTIDTATRPGATFLDRERLRHTVHDTLDWLWDTVSGPILDAIGITAPPTAGTRPPRLWWYPTGPLAFLPLHAAGHHPRSTASVHTRQDSVPDRVISSYTSTLGALLRARHRADTPAATMLAIGIPETPDGAAPLPAVDTEMALLREHFPIPRRGHQLRGPDATRDAVRRHLATHSWVHLACHAEHSRSDPATSAVRLWDGPMTVLDIAEQQLDHAELVYLSACHTASGARQLPDESIHLAAALQLAGFRHVIATLWSVHDHHAPTVADAVYHHLTATGEPDAQNAAYALHQATTQLRANHPTDPTAWAPYLHTGA